MTWCRGTKLESVYITKSTFPGQKSLLQLPHLDTSARENILARDLHVSYTCFKQFLIVYLVFYSFALPVWESETSVTALVFYFWSSKAFRVVYYTTQYSL